MSVKDSAVTIGAAGAPAPGMSREDFFNTMIGTLCETIEDVVGVGDAEAFIGIVGRRMGNSAFAQVHGEGPTDPRQLGEHLVAFKESIGGNFRVEAVEGSRITFTNDRCPFAEQADGRPSLCMMTTNLFGRVAADATGYARVKVLESLSRGHGRCHVTVDLERGSEGDGLEFYG